MRMLLICLLAPIVLAQENPLSTAHRSTYGGLKKIIFRAVELMPEESFAFKPVEAVRTFGQIVGHIADAQYTFCSIALAEKNLAPRIEKNKTSKADLLAALKESFLYCDKAYDGMTDEKAAELVKMMGGDTPKFNVLTVNIAHSTEHYGNLVTYLRMKDVVPPTSDPAFMKSLTEKK